MGVDFFYTQISCNSSKSSEIVILSREEQLKEINAFIDKQLNFMTISSMEEIKNTFYDEMTLIGTDKAEYYTSWSVIKESIEAQMQIIDPKFEQKNRRLLVNIDGNTNTISDVRSSGVIKKIDGEWKIVHIHTSIGIEDQALDYYLRLN